MLFRSDPVKLSETLGAAAKLDEQLHSFLPALLKQELSARSTGAIARPGAGGAAPILTKALDAKTRQYGVQVIDVRVARVAFDESSLSATYSQMRERQELAIDAVRKKSAEDAAAIAVERALGRNQRDLHRPSHSPAPVGTSATGLRSPPIGTPLA